MSDAVDDIRKRYAEATAPHECKIRTVTQAEFVSMPGSDMSDNWCKTNVIGVDGKMRFHVSRQCRPIVDDDWLADVRELLDHIDAIESRQPELRKRRIVAGVVEQDTPVYAPVDRAHDVELDATQAACDHGVTFDQDAAEGMKTEEIRKRWPRLLGECPNGCGYNGIAYASQAHYVYGDW